MGKEYVHVLMTTTPEDGRYADITQKLAPYASEFGLMTRRVRAETTYLILLSKYGVIRPLRDEEIWLLNVMHKRMKLKDVRDIKKIESKTNHDVKAVEKWIRLQLKKSTMADLEEMAHYLLTSEDVNNVAYRLQLADACREVLFPLLKEIMLSFAATAEKYVNLPMLGRTHGQPAVTTTYGKEYSYFLARLLREYKKLIGHSLTGKMNGAVGNYNAHVFLEEGVDWFQFSRDYAHALGLEPNLVTTQIDPPEDIIEFLQYWQRINNILIDFSRDNHRYISDDWVGQKQKEGEAGSSTMANKVNPIDFENAWGNLGASNALIVFLTGSLPHSMLQRDLSDSTVIRRIGPIMGDILIGLTKIKNGLSKVFPNEMVMAESLNKNWAILSEPVQLLLRKKTDMEDPYTVVKNFVRGKIITSKEYGEWIGTLPVSNEVKKELLDLSPERYVGLTGELTQMVVAEANKVLRQAA